jgi:toxin FitB
VILLDTNVLSETMKPAPDLCVIQWLNAHPDEELWISAVTEAEIRLGIALLAEGKRKQALEKLANQMLQEDFSRRCLPFDCEAAKEYALIICERNQRGLPITVEDAQIAAIARASGLTLSTRNIKDFSNIRGLRLINPWTDLPPKTFGG